MAEIVDWHIPRHGLQQGLNWGWVTVIWLSHIVSQGDHRKLTVRDWVAQAHETLEQCTGLDIRDTDFTDDRLSIVLRELSKPAAWQAIEKDLGERIMRVYYLESKRIRLDATTVSGCHEGGDGRLFQFGNSKDDPTLRQVKVMMSVLDPLGMPLTTSVVSGERADDGLYAPSIDRVDRMVDAKGLLFVGDCKTSSLATRAHVRRFGHHYLAPLALVGETGREMPSWIDEAVSGSHALVPVYARVDGHEPKLLGRGYERTRSCTAREDGETVCWVERIFVFNSEDYAKARERGLEQRLSTACAKLNALTPAPGREKRQIREEEQLVRAAQTTLSAHGVEELVAYSFKRREEIEIRYVGRGRGGIERPRAPLARSAMKSPPWSVGRKPSPPSRKSWDGAHMQRTVERRSCLLKKPSMPTAMNGLSRGDSIDSRVRRFPWTLSLSNETIRSRGSSTSLASPSGCLPSSNSKCAAAFRMQEPSSWDCIRKIPKKLGQPHD